MLRIKIFVAILFFSANINFLNAAEPNNIIIRQKPSDGYCGIHCLYAAMKFFGIKCEPNELIKPEYIGSAQGSSLAELKKCAENYGLYAMPVGRLSTKDLCKLPLPMIIHVKSAPAVKKYDHYELFLGSRQGKALIYDVPGNIELVDFWSLAPRWDGSGLLISNKPINLNAVFAYSYLRFVGYAGLAAAIVLFARWGQRRLFGLCRITSRKQALVLSLVQCAILVLTAVSCAFAYHSINDEGLLLRKQATQTIQQAYKSSFVPKNAEKKSQLKSDTK